MAAIPPNTYLEGFKKSMCDGIDGAFNKGVKHGRYLEREENKKKHGHWIDLYEGDPIVRDTVFCCSECNECVFKNFSRTMNYCPNCGAKMDADVQDG